MKEIRSDILIDFSIEEKFEITDMLKTLDVKFNKYDDKPVELLIRYVSVLIEMTKVKVIFIMFITFLLEVEDMLEFFKYCRHNDIILVLIEKNNPHIDFDRKTVTIVDDFILN